MIKFDARAWAVWLFAGGLLALLISNPLYLLLLLIISRVVETACAPHKSSGLRLPFWRISLMILTFSTLLNMLMAHLGQTVLFALPAEWPLIGGIYTLEAAIYGFLNGLRLVTLLSLFFGFNVILPTNELTGLMPRAIYELGLVMLIAITYVPETIRQFQRIRDAQAIRGQEFTSLWAWRPVIIPLLIAGLERSLNLSETMVTRGYGAITGVAVSNRHRWLMAIGLMFAFAGTLRLVWGGVDGWLAIIVGVLLVAISWQKLGRLVKRSRYKPRHWSFNDSLLTVGALFAMTLLVPLAGFGRSSLSYSPYPAAGAPTFSFISGLGLFGLAIPAILTLIQGPNTEATL